MRLCRGSFIHYNRNSPAKKISKKNFLPSVGHIMVAITRMIEIRNAFK